MVHHHIQRHQRIVLGVELEGYTILTPSHEISRKMAFHRKGAGEKGERFTRDWSIGTEYNSRPFFTIREGFFLIKTGLRKYNTALYRTKTESRQARQIFLTGGWRDRFAGTHFHISISGHRMSYEEAKRLASHIHDHIPLLIAIGSNSPVWADEITPHSSTRVIKGSKKYFRPIERRGLTRREFDEMTYSRGRKTKPPTLEVRIMDSNIPEFVMAAACILKACSLAFLRREGKSNALTHFQYLKSRQDAAHRGMKASLCWNGTWMPAAAYLDRFVWTFREEFREMDVPQDVWLVFKLLKKGINGSSILRESIQKAYDHHPQTWQRRFAKRYIAAIDQLLSGNSLLDYMRCLRVKSPNLAQVWLGRKKLKLL